MTVVQSLPKTIGLESNKLVVLDVLRKKRNLSDYAGEEIDETLVENCSSEAEQLLEAVSSWLKQNHPDLAG